jgi:hypothetical protein
MIEVPYEQPRYSGIGVAQYIDDACGADETLAFAY